VKDSRTHCYEPVIRSDGGWSSCWNAGISLTTDIRDSGTSESVADQDAEEQNLLGFPSSYDNLRRGVHWNSFLGICVHAGILLDLFDTENGVEMFLRNVVDFQRTTQRYITEDSILRIESCHVKPF
jgi:hypothetical protein